MDYVGQCKVLAKHCIIGTFISLCEKLAKLHSPFQMACQKAKMKLLLLPYYLKVVGIIAALVPSSCEIWVKRKKEKKKREKIIDVCLWIL